MADSDPQDDDEYELEPIDPEILERERQRADAKVRQAEQSVDINEYYEDEQPEDPITWDDMRGFQFSIRHLLIATAGLAVFLTLWEIGECLALFLGALAALAGGWFYVLKREREAKDKRQIERAARVAGSGKPTDPDAIDYSEFDTSEEPTASREFRFSFSMKELFGAMTVAALMLGLIQILGGAHNAALVLGLIALLGLVIHVVGFDPPPVVVLGWWLLLVLYIVMSLWAAFGSGAVAWLPGETSILFASMLY